MARALRRAVGAMSASLLPVAVTAQADCAGTSEFTFVIFLCMAFQNGFFWQTVLAKAKDAS